MKLEARHRLLAWSPFLNKLIKNVESMTDEQQKDLGDGCGGVAGWYWGNYMRQSRDDVAIKAYTEDHKMVRLRAPYQFMLVVNAMVWLSKVFGLLKVVPDKLYRIHDIAHHEDYIKFSKEREYLSDRRKIAARVQEWVALNKGVFKFEASKPILSWSATQDIMSNTAEDIKPTNVLLCIETSKVRPVFACWQRTPEIQELQQLVKKQKNAEHMTYAYIESAFRAALQYTSQREVVVYHKNKQVTCELMDVTVPRSHWDD